MTENNKPYFNTEQILIDVNKVIENGLKILLNNFIERYDYLDNTHRSLLQLLNGNTLNLEKVVEEKIILENDINKPNNHYYDFSNKLDSLEKKQDELCSILNTVLKEFELLKLNINDKKTHDLSEEINIKEESKENIKLIIEE